MKKADKISEKCLHCGIDFFAPIHGARRGNGKFCSRSCSATKNSTKHGHSGYDWQSPTYSSWATMKSRCTNPKNPKYPNYGALGVTVCERWMNFKEFLADMGVRPEGMTLDRIDTSGNYEPSNCRWATPKQQMRNQKHSVLYTFNGVTKHYKDWADEYGLKHATVFERIKANFSPDRMFLPPNGSKRQKRCGT